jgi:hypothetical protein
MKYSTLFTLLSIIIFVFPWTGLPFGFIRLVVSLFALTIFFLSLGLYQREQKISNVLRDIREQNSREEITNNKKSHETPEPVFTQPLEKTTNKRRLSDML